MMQLMRLYGFPGLVEENWSGTAQSRLESIPSAIERSQAIAPIPEVKFWKESQL